MILTRLLPIIGVAAVATVGGGTTPPLDSYTSGLTGAWSFSRDLLSTFSSARYTDTSGAIDTLVDQTGNSHTLSRTGTQRPTLSTAGTNSRACGDFDGSDDSLRMSGGAGHQLANLIANNNGWIAISFIADVIDANNATVYANECLMGDAGAFMGLFTKTGDAIHVYNWDGNTDTTSASVTEGTAYVAEWRHESGTLYCRLNGGTEVSVASGNTSSLTSALCIGSTAASPSGPSEFDGKIFEMVSYNATPSSTDRDAIVANMMAWIGA